MGDVLTVVAILFGVCLSTWAMVLTMGMMFSSRATLARSYVASRPWKAIGLGALVTLTVGLFALILANSPEPITKLLGTTMLMLLLGVAGLGASGVALHMADRMRGMEPNLSEYTAFSRASGVLVVSMLVPVVGWLLFAPLLLLAGLGAGTHVVLRGRARSEARGEI